MALTGSHSHCNATDPTDYQSKSCIYIYLQRQKTSYLKVTAVFLHFNILILCLLQDNGLSFHLDEINRGSEKKGFKHTQSGKESGISFEIYVTHNLQINMIKVLQDMYYVTEGMFELILEQTSHHTVKMVIGSNIIKHR